MEVTIDTLIWLIIVLWILGGMFFNDVVSANRGREYEMPLTGYFKHYLGWPFIVLKVFIKNI
ncbi:MAG: hypothetical protein DRI71_11470 [Bacteroidetes bacterium]|nr:MAG: hypothetical protein DRI71_11470 [Bacteroidota bacterium]